MFLSKLSFFSLRSLGQPPGLQPPGNADTSQERCQPSSTDKGVLQLWNRLAGLGGSRIREKS